MSMNKNFTIQPYLIFNGRCEEAIEFYKKAADLGSDEAQDALKSPSADCQSVNACQSSTSDFAECR